MTAERLWSPWRAFDHPVSLWIVVGVVAVLVLALPLIEIIARSGRVTPALRQELRARTLSWMVLASVMIAPILLGAAWTILAAGALGLLCYQEYARATGLFRQRAISLMVVLGILAVTFAALDNWYRFFVALFPLSVVVIAIASIPLDRPEGYIQRVALGVFGFLLFGCALGHLGYMANDANYRPIVLLILLAVGANDVFAFCVGKTIGGPKLLPRTSPNKTISGSLGALVLTTTLVTLLSGPIFAGTALDGALPRIGLGVIVSALGQLGDLMLSSIKRDLGIKDIGAAIPGHGGILDRFNSLLLVAPAVFHYINYVVGVGVDQPARLITGG